MKNPLVLASLALILAAACGENPPPPRADAAADARVPDAGRAGTTDASPAPADAAAPDAATSDRLVADAPVPDGSPDIAVSDAAVSDASPAPDASADAGRADAGPTCAGGVSRQMLCSTYCQGIGRVCAGANAQFDDLPTCETVCNSEAWPCGNPGDTTGNSLFCRIAHVALAGIGAAAAECPSAGPNSPVCR